jgi:predicted acetyltransferase
MDVTIRTIREDEYETAARSLEMAFSGRISDEDLAQDRPVTEFDRWYAAFDDGRIVGNAAAASYRMTVPGGATVPTAGITSVGVLPTHRRRGINTALMRKQLDDVHARGEPLAALYASEGGIYGRYGFGVAAFLGEINLEVGRSDFIRGYRQAGSVRLLEREEALPLARPVYDAERARRPGMIEVDDRWWEWMFLESAKKREEEPTRYAVHEVEGVADAFATYTVKHEWPASIARLELTVRRLVASTPQGSADIWRYLFDIDLVHTVDAWNRPADEPLLDLMQEPRRLRFGLMDGLYVRVVDVSTALTARTYATDERLVLEVSDPFCPWNEGRWLLRTASEGVTCEPSDAEADLACTATDLGAVYLGGFGFRRLHRAGRVRELTAWALARADAAFGWDPAPWCAFMF